MEHYTFDTKGTCSRQISFDSDGERVYNIRFLFGCPGNTAAVSVLCEGMKIDDIIEKLSGIDCGGRGTSCPAQLSAAVSMAKKQSCPLLCFLTKIQIIFCSFWRI